MDTTTCPECGAPAEVLDRFALEGTDGPIEHVRVQCVRRHWFLCSTATLARHRAAAPPRPAAPALRPAVGPALAAPRPAPGPAVPAPRPAVERAVPAPRTAGGPTRDQVGEAD